ncbi:MAG TPA: ATP-binding protein [Polyangia bacterium]|jgi:signal transduction histidine kinase/ActR/RegA family two-component response regulator
MGRVREVSQSPGTALVRAGGAARAESLAALRLVADAALAPLPLDELLPALAGRIRRALASDFAAILLLSDDGTRLVPGAADGLDGAPGPRAEIPLGQGVAGRTAALGCPVVVDDIAAMDGPDRLAGPLRSLAGAPIRAGGRAVGVLETGTLDLRHLDDGDVEVLGLMADACALAIDRARAQAEVLARAPDVAARDWVTLIGTVALARDFAERKRREEALDESDRRQRELVEALQEAERRKDEFLAMLSHELRNPLAAISTSGYVLGKAAPGSDHARRAHAVIERQTRHLARIVDDLLDLTRVSRGKIELRRAPMDLHALVRRTAADFEGTLRARAIELELVAADEPIMVDGDATRLAQVVGNLLHNAAKFSDAGGTVTITVAADAGAGAALVRVRDTGIGLDESTLDQLFEPFQQADRSLARTRGGLGLGLALVKRLVEMHGGAVSAASAGLGHGAEFTIRLPLVQTVAPPEPPVAAAAATARRVLIIEDNVDAAESLKEAITFGGRHQVDVAYDGPEGLRKAQELRPDVILCDIGLPGMDGYQVARAVRADPRLRGAHLVALTGYALPEDEQRAAAAGFERHLAKPARLEQLEDVLAASGPPVLAR